MKIIDISREIFTSPCYADDPQPHYRWHKSIYAGDDYNLSVLSMTPHAGTHIDAPLHFIKHGKSVEECTLEKCFGSRTVITISGVLTGIFNVLMYIAIEKGMVSVVTVIVKSSVLFTVILAGFPNV